MESKHVKLGQAESHPIQTAHPIAFFFLSVNNTAFGDVPPQ